MVTVFMLLVPCIIQLICEIFRLFMINTDFEKLICSLMHCTYASDMFMVVSLLLDGNMNRMKTTELARGKLENVIHMQAAKL